MSLDDEESPRRKKRGNLFSSKNLLVFLLVFGLAFGAFLEHQYIEPLLGDNAKKLSACESTRNLLNIENENCLKLLEDCNAAALP